MAYLTEREVRRAAQADPRVRQRSASQVLRESVASAKPTDTFDVFLCHSIGDAELVQGAANILEGQHLKVYVDWIVDPQMDRSAVTADTAAVLRQRLRQSKSLLYLYSNNSRRSRWMPFELGYFDGFNGTVGVLPITDDQGQVDFTKEEYLGLYPKVELTSAGMFVNRTKSAPVSSADSANYRTFSTWVQGNEKLRL